MKQPTARLIDNGIKLIAIIVFIFSIVAVVKLQIISFICLTGLWANLLAYKHPKMVLVYPFYKDNLKFGILCAFLLVVGINFFEWNKPVTSTTETDKGNAFQKASISDQKIEKDLSQTQSTMFTVDNVTDEEWIEHDKKLIQDAEDKKNAFEENCLGGLYNTCLPVELAVMNSMNDPDSYEHVDTRYRIEGDYAIIYMQFRGKNAFGATVLNAVKAKIDMNCQLISIENSKN